jgi:hypothetical protein
VTLSVRLRVAGSLLPFCEVEICLEHVRCVGDG